MPRYPSQRCLDHLCQNLHHQRPHLQYLHLLYLVPTPIYSTTQTNGIIKLFNFVLKWIWYQILGHILGINHICFVISLVPSLCKIINNIFIFSSAANSEVTVQTGALVILHHYHQYFSLCFDAQKVFWRFALLDADWENCIREYFQKHYLLQIVAIIAFVMMNWTFLLFDFLIFFFFYCFTWCFWGL